jgi:hypothetical protein
MVVCLENKCFKLYLFMTFCNVVDWDVFVNMSILKSSITTIGQFVGILFYMVFKIEYK